MWKSLLWPAGSQTKRKLKPSAPWKPLLLRTMRFFPAETLYEVTLSLRCACHRQITDMAIFLRWNRFRWDLFHLLPDSSVVLGSLWKFKRSSVIIELYLLSFRIDLGFRFGNYRAQGKWTRNSWQFHSNWKTLRDFHSPPTSTASHNHVTPSSSTALPSTGVIPRGIFLWHKSHLVQVRG